MEFAYEDLREEKTWTIFFFLSSATLLSSPSLHSL
jgi:hypothetical protein